VLNNEAEALISLPLFTEAPWIHKRNGIYYLSYAYPYGGYYNHNYYGNGYYGGYYGNRYWGPGWYGLNTGPWFGGYAPRAGSWTTSNRDNWNNGNRGNWNGNGNWN
jgi:hypothetical protein